MNTIVCFGDSNTYGTPGMPDEDFWSRFEPGERWPGVLRSALGAEWRVIEEGLPGRTTVHDDPIEGAHKNGLRALPIVLESHRPIDLLIVMLGTNDLKARFAVTPEDIAASIGVLVKTALESVAGPGGFPPKILVIAPAAIAEVGFPAGMFRGGAVKSRQMSRCYAAVAARLGVGFLDAAELIVTDPMDGIHLTSDQHAKLGRAVADTVLSTFIEV